MPAIHATNSPDARVFTYRSRVTRDVLSFYAEEGTIRVVNECTGKETRVSRRDFLDRAKALFATIKVEQPRDERDDTRELVVAMLHAIRAAREQGDPLSRRHAASVRSHRLAARATSVRPAGLGMPVPAWLYGAVGWTPQLAPMLPPIPTAPPDKPMVPLEAVFPERFRDIRSRIVLR